MEGRKTPLEALRAEQVSKRYGPVIALDAVSLTVRRGDQCLGSGSWPSSSW